MGIGGLGQCKTTAYDGPKPTLGKVLQYLGKIPLGTHGRTDYLDLAIKDMPQIRLGPRPAGRSTDDGPELSEGLC